MFITVQILSALIMVATLVNALAVFHQMFTNPKENDSIIYLVIQILTALAAIFVYIYLNYILQKRSATPFLFGL